MELRVASVDDVLAIADLMTVVDPDEPWDPALWRHNWRAWQATGFPARSYLGDEDGRAVAVGEWWFEPPPDGARRFGHVRVATAPPDAGRFTTCLARVEADLRDVGVDAFASHVREFDDFRSGRLRAAGYRPDRLDRWWELDLTAGRERLTSMAASARARVAGQNVTISTIADAERSYPDVLRQVYEVDKRATQDIPTTVPHVTVPFDAWLADLESPGLRRDRMWIAVEDGRVLGMSWLKYPVVRGHVRTDWTGVDPSARGRGLARALKLQTLLQAIELGVERVRTENDEANAPILHLNGELGYHAIPGERLWVKEA